jgi:hypothetical protein
MCDMTDYNQHILEYEMVKILAAMSVQFAEIYDRRIASAIEASISLLRAAAGYRVSKPRAKLKHTYSNGQLTLNVNGKEQPILNAVGKLISASFDPNYRISHRPPRLPRRRFDPPKYRSRDIRFEQG